MFELKMPQQIAVQVKGSRGMILGEAIHGRLRPEIAGVLSARNFVPVAPGKDTPIAVPLPRVPRNADIKRIAFRIAVTAPDQAGPLLEQEAEVKETVGTTVTTRSFDVALQPQSIPRSVTLKLNGGEVFWSSPGAMSDGTDYLVDEGTADAVNAYLDGLPPGAGDVELQFLVRAESACKVRLQLDGTPEFRRLQTQSWVNPQDQTLRADRNLELAFGTIAPLPIDALAVAPTERVALHTMRLDVAGTFGDERVYGPLPDRGWNEFATVSTDYVVAQRFSLTIPLRAVGLGGVFQSGADAEVYIAIHGDANGVPATESPPLATGTLVLQPASPRAASEAHAWSFAAFDAAADLESGLAYWIVLRGIRGRSRVAVHREPDESLTTLLVNRGGQIWKPLDAPSSGTTAALRLTYLPTVDTQSAAVEVAVLSADDHAIIAAQRLDPGGSPIDLALDLGESSAHQVLLRFTSYAAGTLSIANVRQEYT